MGDGRDRLAYLVETGGVEDVERFRSHSYACARGSVGMIVKRVEIA